MNMRAFALFGILGLLAGLSSADGEDWDLHDEKKWCDDYPMCCDGAEQSPIDIDRKAAAGNSSISPLTFSAGYFEKTAGKIQEHGFKNLAGYFEPKNGGPALKVSGGPLGGDSYLFHNLHFHFGKSSKKGSPHFMDGKQYPGELHMVHYNSKYDDIQEALEHYDGVVVLAFLLEEKKKIDKFPSFKLLEKSLKRARKSKGKKLDMALSDFFLAAGGVSEYYYYHGSMMMPPCSEVINWLVFEPIEMKESQFDVLRKLEDKNGKKFKNNFRKLQDIGGRPIYHVTRD